MKSDNDRAAFTTDIIHRVAVEAARLWVIEAILRTKKLPEPETRFCYPGPDGFGWGDDPDSNYRPLRGKRVSITFQVEDY